MTKKQLIQLFEDRKVRTVWDDELQKWFFSIVDVCHVLTDSKDYQTARKYWNKLKVYVDVINIFDYNVRSLRRV